MQLLCHEGTLKETKWQAIKSKGVVLVFRMFRLDGHLSKDSKDWDLDGGAAFIRDYGGIKVGNCMGGVTSLMLTSGGTYWNWQESWLLPGHDPSETPGTIHTVCWDLEREQGLTGGWVIISRKVTHRYVRKTMTYRIINIFLFGNEK